LDGGSAHLNSCTYRARNT